MPSMLSEHIAALRKERGLTQEQLGKLVGVSSQAVGKWEKGGAPDVELLPVLSRQLGVTIDALFGLEGGEQIDMEDAVRRWAVTVPKDQRIDWLCRLVWIAAGPIMSNGPEDLIDISGYDSRCESEDAESNPKGRWLRRTRITTENGTVLGVRANDMSFVSVWPEPKAGWKSFFEDNERYRKLFAVLAKPNCLELLEHLHTRPPFDRRRYTPGAIAKALGLDAGEVETLMDALAEVGTLSKTDLETEDGILHSYLLGEDEGLVPLLYFARWFITSGQAYLDAPYRRSPMLREPQV